MKTKPKADYGYDYRDGENITLYEGNAVVGQLYGTGEDAIRRAHLWEAAPELLDALSNCLHNSRRLAEESGKEGVMTSHFAYIEGVLAKAQGR